MKQPLFFHTENAISKTFTIFYYSFFAASTWSYRFLQFQLELENLCQVMDQRQSIYLILPVSVNHNFGVQRWLHIPT